jgi:hypothetical protein
MSNYTKITNFATKDNLASGNPLKVIKGTEIDDEFENVETHIATKADSNSPAFTGTPLAPTASAGTANTQIATTGFVDAYFAPKASPTFTGTATIPTAAVGTVDFGDFSVTETSGDLFFSVSGTDVMKLDASGNITVIGDVTAFGTL